MITKSVNYVSWKRAVDRLLYLMAGFHSHEVTAPFHEYYNAGKTPGQTVRKLIG